MNAGAQAVEPKQGLEARGVPEVRLLPLEPALSDVAKALSLASADVVVVGGWPEPLGGWPRRSVTDVLLEELASPLLITA